MQTQFELGGVTNYMLTKLIFTMFGYALLDCLNPATIMVMAVSLPIVKKRWHSLMFTFGSFVSYFAVGFLSYLGMDFLINKWVTSLISGYPVVVGITLVALSIILLFFSLKSVLKLVVAFVKKDKFAIKEFKPPVDITNPIILFVMALPVTVVDATTALPYVGFIATLISAKASVIVAFILLILYCLIYILPTLVLFFIYNFFKIAKFKKIEGFISKSMNVMNIYLTPIMMILFGVILMINGIKLF